MEDATCHLARHQNPIRRSVRRTLHGFSLRRSVRLVRKFEFLVVPLC